MQVRKKLRWTARQCNYLNYLYGWVCHTIQNHRSTQDIQVKRMGEITVASGKIRNVAGLGHRPSVCALRMARWAAGSTESSVSSVSGG